MQCKLFRGVKTSCMPTSCVARSGFVHHWWWWSQVRSCSPKYLVQMVTGIWNWSTRWIMLILALPAAAEDNWRTFWNVIRNRQLFWHCIWLFEVDVCVLLASIPVSGNFSWNTDHSQVLLFFSLLKSPLT